MAGNREIGDLPQVEDLTELVRLLNDRLRRMAESSGASVEGDLDMRGHRILNLGDARGGGDAVSRSYGDRRYLAPRRTAAAEGGQTAAPGQAAAVRQQLTLTAPGTLGVGSRLAALAMLPERKSATGLVALLKQAPLGADLVVAVRVGESVWAEITVPAGETRATRSGSDLAAIAADTLITLDVVQCGTVFPGADLSVLVRL